MKTVLIILAMMVAAKPLLADSPLTSTSLHIGFEDNDLVKDALKTHELTKKQLDFFIKSENLPEKIAIISAFSWSSDSSAIYENLRDGLIKARGGADKLKTDDNLVLAYAQALDDYFDMSKAFVYLDKINFEEEKRESAIWILNLCVMQAMLDDMNQWCNIYKRSEAIKAADWLVRDMNTKTLTEGIYSYIDIYAGTCTE